MLLASLVALLPLCPLPISGVFAANALSEPLGLTLSGVSPSSAQDSGPESSTVLLNSIEQFGIRWNFNRTHQAGQFANGDWWVVGPVKIVSISPRSTRQSNGRVMNGSMLNPSPTLGLAQGYDSTTYGQYATATSYQDGLNVALDVSERKPLMLQPHSSLVSTISDPLPGVRAQLLTAAILTVLPKAPPAGSFRPAYCGKNKSIQHNVSDLDRSMFLSLEPVNRRAPLADTQAMLARPWLDHVPGWLSTYIHPHHNMPNYGREMADLVGVASLILNLDLGGEARTDSILIELTQIGIDYYGILEDGGQFNWQSGGGHHSGRKWPILFAGIVLGDPGMSSIGFDPNLLIMGEDGQTFFVEETSPGVYNNGFGGYTKEQEGMAEWGSKHAIDPSFDDVSWFNDPYRRCCTANSWTGIVLSAYMMGAVELWNHPPLFAYQDRFVKTQKSVGGSVATSFFTLEMWDRYRDSFQIQ